MHDLFTEYKTNGPSLILGKGPSFRQLSNSERDSYITIALNHAVREQQVDVAHIIDIDVLDQLGDSLIKNCSAIFMPYYPHLAWRPHGFLTLKDLCEKHPVLSKVSDRVYGYNLSTASTILNLKWNDSPIVWASFFSAEAVVNLLAKLGVKQIRTLGVDGGKGQASNFSDLQNINQNGYDAEWSGIRKSIRKYSLDYSPLGIESPIRIFVGAGDQQLIPGLVLKHSIEKHATMSVNVTIMNEWTHPMPKDAKNMPRTPFSFQRFMIPEKCGYEGHAIYMDSDMLVFGDVKEMWQAPMTKLVLAMRNDDIDKHKAKFSVIKIDCEKSDWPIKGIIDSLDWGYTDYENLVFNCSPAIAKSGIEDGWNPDWNSLEEYTECKTKLLHYTEMYNQPWLVNPDHPLGYLWFAELKEAVADGSISKELITDHVSKRWLLPKCLEVLNG